jgi:hypothetical protein
MNAPGVLESSDTLNETWLDDELACLRCDGGAEWHWAMKCCGASLGFVCETHDSEWRENAQKTITSPKFCHCGACGMKFGFHPRFEDAFKRLPI